MNVSIAAALATGLFACSSGNMQAPPDAGVLDAVADAGSPTDDTGLPPDPTTVAPPLDRSVATSLIVATRFLYTGEHPIQTGVDPATMDIRRVAVLRGRVSGNAASPVTGATVTVLGHPEFGQTLTRADGAYDLVVDGGGALSLVIRKDGFLETQRTLDVPWQDYVQVPEIVLIQPDPAAPPIDLDGPGTKIARGPTVNDAAGTRRATLLFPPGVQATIETESGTKLLPTLTVHLTEFTAGPRGVETMPGSLPPTSAYTYAVDIAVDEAAGRSVTLSQPALLYLENFLGFAVGTGMPVGAYDRDEARWRGLPNGLVLQIIGITAGAAEIDTDGDGAPDSPAALAALGISDTERQTLATLYTAGQTLWRSPVPHFSIIDCNRPFRLPPDAGPPLLRAPRAPGGEPVDDSCSASGSIIQCHNQSLGEVIPINGTPYTLHYQSDRHPGRITDYSTDIPLSDDETPASVIGIELDIGIAGRSFHQSFSPARNQHTVFTWDGLDAYGRAVQGRATAVIDVGYIYEMHYADPAPSGNQFGNFPGAIDLESVPVPGRETATLRQRWKTQLGAFDALPMGLGGFTLSDQHVYDLVGKILYLGNGETRQASTLGGSEINQALISSVQAAHFDEVNISLREDGRFYVVDPQHNVVRDELGAIVAGVLGQGGVPCTTTDGVLAIQSALCMPTAAIAGPDGSLYILQGDARIRRVTRDGIVHTIGGRARTGPISRCALEGVGGPAAAAQLCDPRNLVVARDGALYFRDVKPQILKIGADGFLSIVAGTGSPGFSGDGGPASQAQLSTDLHLAIDFDGNLVVLDSGNLRIRRIATDGVITTIAGTGMSGDTGDGGPATSATFQRLAATAVGPDGSIYVADSGAARYRVISAQGIITAFAGGGPGGGGGIPPIPINGLPPADATFFNNVFVAAGADGAIYLGENRAPISILYRVAPSLPAYSITEHVIPSEAGGELYVFDNAGRHLRTLDSSNGAVRRKFGYDGAGRLISITDLDGQVTTIERDRTGAPTAFVAPFGQRTMLANDAAGYLSQVTDPAGVSQLFTYDAGGLLATYTDLLGGIHTMRYDDLGRLLGDMDPGQSEQTLARVGDSADSTVTMRTSLGRQASYRIQRLATGDEIWSNSGPDGSVVSVQREPDGSTTSTSPDGTTMTMQIAPDPRFGMLSPVPAALTIRTPGGLVQTQGTTRTAQLRDRNDLTSLISATETFVLNGKAFTRVYDGMTRTITVTSPLGRTTSATVDDRGRIVSVTNPSIAAMQFLYDSSGRSTSLAQGTRQLALTYGTDGYVATSSDTLAHTTSYDRDPLGRITAEHASDGTTFEFSFDAASEVLRLRPAGGSDHRVNRDILGLVHTYVAPDVGPNTSQTTYSYNADHQITSITAPDGAMLSVSYDTAGRPDTVAFPDGTINAGFDAAGRLSTLAAPDGVRLTLGYDGSLPTDVTWSGPVSGALHIAYDNDFRVASESLNGEPPVAVRYDDDGLVTNVGALTITRDVQTGRVKQTAIGSVTETYSFSDLGELSNSTVACGGATLRAVTLGRDVSGVITSQDETVLGQTSSLIYDHDAKSRLTAVHGTGASSMYSYDDNGNRRSVVRPDLVAYSYDAQDRLTQQGSTSYTYTASGQLLTKADLTGTTSYHYDLVGNLRSVQLPNGHSVAYIIDGRNRRIGKQVDNVLSQGFLYDDATSVIAELDGTGTVVSRFVYGTRGHVPDYLVKGGATYRIVSDIVGSPRLIVDVATCHVVQRIDYDEFGRVVADTNPGFQPFGFAGGLRDLDTGLLRFGARDYDPDIGRWTAKDPLGFGGGDTNLYVYAANNPINFIDPSGLSFLQGLTDFSAGFGDFATLGLTRWIRRKLGVNDVVNPCSGLYLTGGITGAVVTTIAAGGVVTRWAAARAARGLLAESEAAGGHLIARHVGLDAAALDARLAAQVNLTVTSSFSTLAEAEGAASAAFTQNSAAITAWVQAGAAGRITVTTAYSGGIVRLLGGYSADAVAAKFVLQGDGAGAFFVLTGFPVP